MWKWIFIGIGIYTAICIILGFTHKNKDQLKCPKCGKKRFRQDYRGFNPAVGYSRIEYNPIGYQWNFVDGRASLNVLEKREETRYYKDHRKFVCENCGHVLKEEDCETGSRTQSGARTQCPECDSTNYQFWFENRVDTRNLLEGDYMERCLDCGHTECHHYRHEVDDREIAAMQSEMERDHAKFMRKQEKYFRENYWEPKKYTVLDEEIGKRVTLTQVSKYSNTEYRDNFGRYWTKTGPNKFCKD